MINRNYKLSVFSNDFKSKRFLHQGGAKVKTLDTLKTCVLLLFPLVNGTPNAYYMLDMTLHCAIDLGTIK